MKIDMLLNIEEGDNNEIRISELSPGEFDSLRILLLTLTTHGKVLYNSDLEGQLSLRSVIEKLSK